MKSLLLLFCCCLFFTMSGFSQNKKFDPAATISADSARHSIRNLLTELSLKHPGFYRYSTKAGFDQFIDSSLSAINGPQNQLSYYRALKPIIGRIRCVHTGATLSADYARYLDSGRTLVPLDLYFTGNKVFVSVNHSGNAYLPPGTEILAINNKPIAVIKQLIFNNIPSDGYNQTFKYQIVNNRFSQWYRSIIEVAEEFKITFASVMGPQVVTVTGVHTDVIPLPPVMDLKDKPRLTLTVNGKQAVLTILSFAESDIKAGGQKFKKFVADAFKQLQAAQVTHLVLDLRNNTGGTDANAALLCSYLMNKPYRYWDRIEVTEPLAKSVKGLARFVYGKPVKKDSTYLWSKSMFSKEFDFVDVQKPKSNAYSGKVSVLINGACLSSCGDIAAVLQHNNRAIFIGEETGGGYLGNNSGIIPNTEVAFGITVSVPLLKYTTAVTPGKNIGHGTQPDIKYTRTIDDVLLKKDPEMEMALRQP